MQGDFLRNFWKYLKKNGLFSGQAKKDIEEGWNFIRTLREPVRSTFNDNWHSSQSLTPISDSVRDRYPGLDSTGRVLDRETDPYKKKLLTSNPSPKADDDFEIFDDDFKDIDGE